MVPRSIAKPASTVTFGIEIELTLPRTLVESPDSAFHPGEYHSGLQIIGAPVGWTAQRDASIKAYRGYVGVEVVSPILQGEEGLQEVVFMVDLLRSLGARFNSSCGIHVHVGAGDLSEEQRARFVSLFIAYEMAFYGLNGGTINRRLASPYCRPSGAWNLAIRERYRSLNVTNLRPGKSGTLEIRAWQTYLKPEMVIGAIYSTVALLSMATDTTPLPNRLECPLAAMEALTRAMWSSPDYLIVPDDGAEDIREAMLFLARYAANAMTTQLAA